MGSSCPFLGPKKNIIYSTCFPKHSNTKIISHVYSMPVQNVSFTNLNCCSCPRRIWYGFYVGGNVQNILHTSATLSKSISCCTTRRRPLHADGAYPLLVCHNPRSSASTHFSFTTRSQQSTGIHSHLSSDPFSLIRVSFRQQTMSCLLPTDPEPMVTESLISLLIRGTQMQARDGSLTRGSAPPAPSPDSISAEERRLRIRSALQAAAKLTSEGLEEDEDDFDPMVHHFSGFQRQQ